MFYLWHEEYDPKHPKFHIVKQQKELPLQQYCLYADLAQIGEHSFSYPQYDHYFLLDDGRFHFFRFDIYREEDSVFTMDDFNKILQERIDYLKSQTKEELLFTNVDSIYINGEAKKFLIGERGQIFFRLYLIYLNRDTILALNRSYGNIFNHKHLKIFPESFKTLSFLKRKLQRDNFLLLYIKEGYCKVIAVEDWFYKQIDHLNFGISYLMQIYKDNQIVKYRYKSQEEIEANPLAKNLVLEAINFYVGYLCKWLEDLNLTDKDIFLVSPIIKNGNFMDCFNTRYASYHSKYIVPFHSSTHLETFGKQRDPGDMDTLIFLNGKELKKQIICS